MSNVLILQLSGQVTGERASEHAVSAAQCSGIHPWASETAKPSPTANPDLFF